MLEMFLSTLIDSINMLTLFAWLCLLPMHMCVCCVGAPQGRIMSLLHLLVKYYYSSAWILLLLIREVRLLVPRHMGVCVLVTVS